MREFARVVVCYHGCERSFADALLLGQMKIQDWRPSENNYDWLGAGIYFWEHSSKRAMRWAEERFGDQASVVGAIVQLGECFDLLDEEYTAFLAKSFESVRDAYAAREIELPVNRGRDKKLRYLDCTVINDCLDELGISGIVFDTVRGAFLEGEPIFDGTTISAETHIQIAVRNVDCILGVFRPN